MINIINLILFSLYPTLLSEHTFIADSANKGSITRISNESIAYRIPPIPYNQPSKITKKPNLKNNSDKIINCTIKASKKYELPTAVLLGVSSQEGGSPGIKVRNKNDTYDIGYMQFNTSYLKLLSKYNIKEEDLNKDNCYPYELAAWRIKNHILNDEGSFLTKVANYHSKTHYYNTIYQNQLINKIKEWDSYLTQANINHIRLSENQRLQLSNKNTRQSNNKKNNKKPSKSSKIYVLNNKNVRKNTDRTQNNDGFSSKIDLSNLYRY